MEWPAKRGVHAATCVSGPLLVIMGGMMNTETVTGDCWIYDFTTKRWKKVIVMEKFMTIMVCNLKFNNIGYQVATSLIVYTVW